jgi:hypothetical protein
MRPYQKNAKVKNRAIGVAEVVEPLHNKHKAVSSNPHKARKKPKITRRL